MTAHVGDDPTTAGPLLVTIRDAGRILAIGRSSVYELISSGQLRPVRFGRSVRVPLAQLHELIERAADRTVS